MNALRIAGLLTALAAPGVSQTPPAQLSTAQVEISRAQQAVVGNPENHEHYNDLALALARRAAETADTDYYALAEGALEESFRLAPQNRQEQYAWAWIARAKQRFETGRAFAETFREVRCELPAPDDDKFPNAEARPRSEEVEGQPRTGFVGRNEDQ